MAISSSPAPRNFGNIDGGGVYDRVIKGEEEALMERDSGVSVVHEIGSGVRNGGRKDVAAVDFSAFEFDDDEDTNPGLPGFLLGDDADTDANIDDPDEIRTLVMKRIEAKTLVPGEDDDSAIEFDLTHPDLAED